ncbi:hypothetical protein KDA_22740 [Dictyobacter alpinus]|uniref:PPM-type phosphatase domain-containing protein n=1 Tax=Dictyobacter alpinus TaxID=2014873 RepID=A0A402B632_9CHLR|nr:protein phosphatase 2C domain-containing protein [Dictyobacter alpinus]GCE26790.1 hypothetical protein KDA_22740 [Dictyobacter alpinus]
MLCPLCHTQNRDNARFCKGCGQPLAVEVVAEQPEVAEQPTIADQDQTQGTPPPSSAPDNAVQADEENAQARAAAPTAASEAPVQQQDSAEKEQSSAEQDGTSEEDVSQAPTQILTQQQMLAFHAKRWQQEAERGHQSEAAYSDIADAPTILMRPGATPDQAPTQSASIPAAPVEPDRASMASPSSAANIAEASTEPDTLVAGSVPEALVNGHAAATDAQAPAPPPAVQTDATSSVPVGDQQVEQEETYQGTATPVEGVTGPTKEENVEPTTNEGEIEANTPEQTPNAEVSAEANPTALPTLEVGKTVGGRYEVMQVLNTAEAEQTYIVTDRQGYLHCWNCGSEENTEGDEFCLDCGAELLNASYILHEYPATGAQTNEAQVLQGSIVNTFVEDGVTYVVEQPQTAQAEFPNGVHLVAACDSDAGAVRRSEANEDSTMTLVFERVHESIASPAGLFVVADGMGGHANGQGASRTTIALISERVTRELLLAPLQAEKAGEAKPKVDDETYKEILRGAVEDANTSLCQINQKEKSDMGSTLTGFMVVGDHAYIFNVGDSRTYMLRDEKLYQLTNDHSLVGQLVAGGIIEPDDVYTHPQRNQIFRSIGDKQNVQVDLFTQQVHPGDILLSCSDGLWEMIRDPQIASILNQAPDPQAACAQLIETANANGGEDNISAVVVFIR